MFADLSIEKLLVLALTALFVLCPERLPAAVSWTARAVRSLRSFVDDTQGSLQRELGPDFDELRQPLRALRNQLRRRRAGPMALLERPHHLPPRTPRRTAEPAPWRRGLTQGSQPAPGSHKSPRSGVE